MIPKSCTNFSRTLSIACYEAIRAIQKAARAKTSRANDERGPQAWPMIVLRTPKGWTCPKELDGVPIEGTFRAHQVPLSTVLENPEHLKMLEAWMRQYHPEQLFDGDGKFQTELAALAPEGNRRMGANPHVNGGRLLKSLDLPDFAQYALADSRRRRRDRRSPAQTGRIFARRDEAQSRKFSHVLSRRDEFESPQRRHSTPPTAAPWSRIVSIDDHLAPDGRVMEVLSEHLCEGWLEGYLLTGRHGMWSSYEAFAQAVDSMITQHAKWMEQCIEFPWRRPIASLNVLLTSHAWRNDHNGFSHQAPGFVDNVLQRRSEVVRVYYPPDANCLLNVFDHCLRSRNYINVVTCGKQPALQWLTFDEALAHCSQGASIWKFATNDGGSDPDIVLACAGDIPTMEACAASWLLQKHVPGIKVRVVNVVDLNSLMSPDDHPHGMDNISFNALFTRDIDVVFAFHGYRWIIHSMVHGRANEARFHVRGFNDMGSTTTPFDMVVLNKMSRFHLAIDALKHIPRLRSQASDAIDMFNRKLYEHNAYIRQHFEDLPEIRNWSWTKDFSEPAEPAPLAKGQPRGQLFSDA